MLLILNFFFFLGEGGVGGNLNQTLSVLIFWHIIKMFIVMGKDGTFLICPRKRPLVIIRNNHENETLKKRRRTFSSPNSCIFNCFQHLAIEAI